MKTILAFLVVNLVFVGANFAAARTAFELGTLVAQVDSPWVWLAVGYAAAGTGVAFTVAVAWLVARCRSG